VPNLLQLPSRDRNRALRVVVETPARSTVKLSYAPDLEIFEFSRSLPLGIAYPYDWGFVPGTHAADGDPLDAMVIHDGITHPGVVIPCRAIGVVCLTEKTESRKRRIRNDRIIAVPVDDARLKGIRGLSRRVRTELEHFFLAVTALEGKEAHVEGWAGLPEAQKLIRDAQRALDAAEAEA